MKIYAVAIDDDIHGVRPEVFFSKEELDARGKEWIAQYWDDPDYPPIPEKWEDAYDWLENNESRFMDRFIVEEVCLPLETLSH